MKKLLCLVISICSLAFALTSLAKTVDKAGTKNHYVQNSLGQLPFFQRYSLVKTKESLHINVIFQDRTGYMWYGTNNGLFKFDGVTQKQFRASDGLPDENVTALAQDSSGKIWTGYKNGKLAFFENGIVKNFEPREGSASEEVSHILLDQQGNLWFSTLGDGLYYFTEDRLYRLDETDMMPDLFIYDIAEDNKGNIWVGTDRGAAMCTMKGKSVSIKNINEKNGLPDNIIKELMMNGDGTIWMGTDNAGIINYNPLTGQFKPLIKEWDLGTVTDFLFQQNKAWISCREGHAVFDIQTQQ